MSYNSKRFNELWPMERDIKKDIQELRDEISNQEQQLGRSESAVRGQASQYQTNQFEIYKKNEEALLELKREKLRNLWARQKEIDDEIAPLRILFYKAEKLKEEREEEEKQRKLQGERAAVWAADVERAREQRERGVNARGRPLPYHMLPKHLQARHNNIVLSLQARRRIEAEQRESKIQERMTQLRAKSSLKNNSPGTRPTMPRGTGRSAALGLRAASPGPMAELHAPNARNGSHENNEWRKSWQANWPSRTTHAKNSLKNNSKKASGPLSNKNLMGGKRTRSHKKSKRVTRKQSP